MKGQRSSLAFLLLIILCVLQFTNVLGYAAHSSLTPLLTAGISTSELSSQKTNQILAGSPCLTSSAADTSSAQVQPGTASATIPGSVVPDVQSGAASFASAVPAGGAVHLELVFKLRNQAAFQKCLNAIQDPSSPYYGDFLNSTTLQPYMPTPGERASLTTFFTRAGFSVTPGASPLVLELAGNVGIAERTLGVAMNYYQSSGSTFYAINTNPSLPSTFTPLLNGILGLDNYSTPKPVESPCSNPYCPQGIQIGYSLTNLYNAGDNGAGQTVAIVDAPGDPTVQSTINTFDSQYSLPSVTINVLTPDGSPGRYDAGWAAETALDVEAVHTVAPGASITLLYGSSTGDDLVNLIDYVAAHHLANIVSNSWIETCTTGNCDDIQLPSSFVSSTDGRLASDAAQGLTIVFASGDSGAKPDGSNLGTQFPASDPNVLSIGATDLTLTGCGPASCTGYGSESGDTISGGGYSGYFAEPSWQMSTIGSTATRCTSGHLQTTCRAVPDVSMIGGILTGVWVYSSYTNTCGSSPPSNNPGWFGCSGTSLSNQLWAAFLAICLQVRNGSVFGNIGPLLYQTASNPTFYSSDFHDITSGSNNGYSAGTGWDPVTGWGTPVASNLALTLNPARVLFQTIPSTFSLSTVPGNITAVGCGGSFVNGQSSPCAPSFTATANLPTPPTGWQFLEWLTTGGISCGSTQTTSCTFTGSGSLTAVFSAQVEFHVSGIAGQVIGWGSCSGPDEGDGATLPATNFGTVSACYVPTGYSVSRWSCTGGLTCSGSGFVTGVSFIAPGAITLTLQSTGSLSNPASTNITAVAFPSNPTHGSTFTVSGNLTIITTGQRLQDEGIVLIFSWNTMVVTVTTNSTGGYSSTVTAPSTPGSYNVDAFFLGDYNGPQTPPQYLPSKATAHVIVS